MNDGPIPLLEQERNMLKIPLPYLSRLPAGEHTATLKVFRGKYLQI
jgi:hypothetical protein